MTRRWRRFLIPGLSTLIMLIVLIGLGTWQIYRLRWKEGVLAQIAMAEAAAPVPLPAEPRPFTKVVITGRFLFDKAAAFGAEVRDTRTGPTMGFYQIVPLERDHGPVVLVNRGWVPQERTTPLNEPRGPVSVVGYVHEADKPGWFSAPDDTAERHFYTLDPVAIGTTAGIVHPAPFVLMAMGAAVTGSYPVPAQQLPRPLNNHLSYVMTWYGLAVALIVIFVAWVWRTSRP